jgi:hypothetical protein
MRPRVHYRRHRNAQESYSPDGELVSQEVLRFDYCAVTRGPLVYATDLIDGYKIEETLRLQGPSESWLETVSPTSPAMTSSAADISDAAAVATIRLRPAGRAPLTFHPYFLAGGRRDRTWRLTWMQLAPE